MRSADYYFVRCLINESAGRSTTTVCTARALGHAIRGKLIYGLNVFYKTRSQMAIGVEFRSFFKKSIFLNNSSWFCTLKTFN